MPKSDQYKFQNGVPFLNKDFNKQRNWEHPCIEIMEQTVLHILLKMELVIFKIVVGNILNFLFSTFSLFCSTEKKRWPLCIQKIHLKKAIKGFSWSLLRITEITKWIILAVWITLEMITPKINKQKFSVLRILTQYISRKFINFLNGCHYFWYLIVLEYTLISSGFSKDIVK